MDVETAAFDKIDISGNMSISYSHATTCSVTLKGQTCQLEEAKVETKNGQLNISKKSKSRTRIFFNDNDGNDKIEVILSAPSLKGIQLTGACDFNADSINTDEAFELSLSGAGNVKATKLSAQSFEAKIAGAGDVRIGDVFCKKSLLNLTGAGNINTHMHGVDDANINISGAGNAKVQLTDCDAVSVNLSGAGEVTIVGSPKKLNQSISGAGKVNIINQED